MPQLEDGYTRLANELVEAYTRSRIPGEAMQCLWFIIRKTYGFNKLEDRISISQFSEATGLKRQHAHRGISKLVELNIVTKKGDGISVSYRINKTSSTWRLSPKKVTSPKKVLECPVNGDKGVPKKVNTKETLKETITKENIYSVFNFWNAQGIVKHRAVGKYESNINASLKEYTVVEIKKAIENYNTILNDDLYYWTHKWTLKDFLQRGLDQFSDENNPFDNYKANKGKGGYKSREEKNREAKEAVLAEAAKEIVSAGLEVDITPAFNENE